MQELSDWLRVLNKKYNITKWVAKPASFDWQWINCLYNKYLPNNPFPMPFSIKCISSMLDVCKLIKFTPKDLKSPDLKHTHNALDDAKEQGYQFLRLTRQLEKIQIIV